MSGQAAVDAAFWALASSDEPPTALADLDALVRRFPGTPLTVVTVLVDQDDPVGALASSGYQTLRFGVVSALRIPDEAGDFVVSVWPAGDDDVFHLAATVPSTDSRWRKLDRRVAAAAPIVVPFFLNHDDFAAIGTALSEQGDVEVSRMTARDREDQSSLSKGWPSKKGTTRPAPEDVLAYADDSGAVVRTMTLHVDDVLAMHLRRRAGATFYSGDFALFDELVLGRLAAAGGRRRLLLDGRARQVGQRPARPLTIRLPSRLFTSAERTGELIDALSCQRDMGVAVMHRNPYLHVVATDYLDGSNFDVFVTAEDAIDIHPGFRASVGALGRLTQALSERFLARDVAEQARPAKVSLDDLVATG